MLDRATGALRRLGRQCIGAIWRLGYASRFFAAVLMRSGTSFRRFRLVIKEIYFAGVLSLIIIIVSGLFVGMVLGLQGYETLQRYGSAEAVGTLVYAWPDAVAKAQKADAVLRERLDRLGLVFDEVRTEYVGWNATHGPLAGPPPEDLAEVELRVAVKSEDKAPVERFTREIAPLILSGPPGVTGFAGGRPRVQDIVAYWPALIDRSAIEPGIEVEVVEV